MLMHLAMTGLFRAKWTNEIHEEWIRNVLKDRSDLNRNQLERTRDLMNEHVLDCVVESYEELIPSLKLPDENDRHVLAAAIRCKADVIVTFNLKDFPSEELNKYDIEPQHPDDFVHNLFDLDNAAVVSAVKRHRASLKNPPIEVDQFLSTLEKQGLAKTVDELRDYSDLI
jgi:predicted nucleic acid-binding protein